MQLLQKSTYSETHNIDADPVKHLESSTAEYLHMSFLLWEYKRAYSKKEYRELLNSYGWDKGSTEERRALKLAKHFEDFAYRPHALVQIPVTTLLRLCSDKYKSIIEELKQFDDEDITCDGVLNLIKARQAELKKEKELQLPKKPSIWRRDCNGKRYAQFPPVYEDDEQTGILTQKLMDQYGLIPQNILRQAIAALYEKITERHHEETATEVEFSQENSCEDNYDEPVVPVNLGNTVEEKWLALNQLLKADIENIGEISQEIGKLIFENCQQWETVVPASKKWSAIANICGRDQNLLKYLSNYAQNNYPEWEETWSGILANDDNFKEELEWVSGEIRINVLMKSSYKIGAIVEVKAGDHKGSRGRIIGLQGDNTAPIFVKMIENQSYFQLCELEIVTSVEMKASHTTVEEVTDEEYLHEPEESDIELEATLLDQEYLQQEENYLHEPEESDIELEPTLLDKAIDTLIHGNWESIRDLFNEHPEIKEEAWNGLSSEQKRRVVDITPETVKVLNQAKKEGVIEEYKEIAVGVYNIKLPGTILWEQRAFHEIEIHYYLRRWREAMN